MIDRYLLRYFLAVVDRGTFSKAAEQLNVAQPTLSVGVAKLERLLGAPLFHRSSQRVTLTEAGVRLAVHARRIESEFNLAEASVLGMKASRLVRLGVLSTIPSASLAAFVRALADAGGEDRLEIVGGSERELLQRLGRGRIDLALTIIRSDADRFASESLFSEGYALAMPATNPLAGQQTVAAEALADNTMIVRRHCEVLSETSRHFTERGVRPFFAFKSTNDDMALALVQAGLGLTVMPQSHQAPGVARPKLAGFDLRRTIGLLYAPHAEALQYGASTVVEALRTQFRS
jgi:DNA-binding transcriptional LysR family regulator